MGYGGGVVSIQVVRLKRGYRGPKTKKGSVVYGTHYTTKDVENRGSESKDSRFRPRCV